MNSARRKWLLIVPAGLLALCLVAVIAVMVSNQFLPEASTTVERLNGEEKARLAEVFHLRQKIGDEVWPGWAEAQIPLVVFNEAYAFLVRYPGEPPAGWQDVPEGETHGGPWAEVPGDTFRGEPYYRLPLPEDGSTPEAFTVRVGDAWVASMQTKEWMNISFVDMFREQVPVYIQAAIPYRLAVNLFVGGSDKYVSVLLHESFHAYQGQVAPQRLAATERGMRRAELVYPWQDEALEAMWQSELDLLREALLAETLAEQEQIVQQFLAQRAERREAAGLNAQAVRYEQEREWLEGLAKYAEMEVWRQGATSEDYEPVSTTTALDDFEQYTKFQTAWEREVDQIARMAGDEGDGRFYYSGMAQAALLDALRPGWKEIALTTDITLEALLAGENPAAPASASTADEDKQVVEVYLGNSSLNPEAACDVVFPVTRTVSGDAPAGFAALKALFSGPTPAEQAADYHSWFSEETANALIGLKIAADGTAYIDLADLRPVIPNASTSCGSLAFRAQVETTLQAAEPGVRRVIYAIEGDPRAFYEWMQMGCTAANDQCDPEPFRE